MLQVLLQAQVTTGNILGFATDQSNAGIPGVQIVLTNVDTGYTRTLISEDDGSYRALLLPGGRYAVRATKPGFQNFVQEGVLLTLNQNARVDIRLRVGDVTERVTVSAEAIGVDTNSSQLTTGIQSEQLRELPINGNRFLSLASLAPGVKPVNQGYGVNTNPLYNFLGGDAQATGSRFNASDYQLDSSHYRMNAFGGSAMMPTAEAIQELKVITGNFSAEYGLSSGLVVNVATKTGSNSLHGSVYDTLGNDKFNSRTFTAAQKPKLRYNQFGASIGGPVFIPKLYNGKDRSFFFFSYEGIRQPAQSLVSGAFPVPEAMRSGDFSSLSTTIKDPQSNLPFPGNIIPPSRLNPFTSMVAKAMPQANFGTQWRGLYPLAQSENQISARGDQYIGERTRVFGRIFWDHPTADNTTGNIVIPGLYGEFARTVRNRDITVNLLHNFRSNLLTQTTFATNRVRAEETVKDDYLHNVQNLGVAGWNLDNTPQTLPNMSLAGGLIAMQNSGLLFGPNDKSYQANNLTTWIMARHTLKVGFEYARWYSENGIGYRGSGSDQGSFSFSGQVSGNPYADFMLGLGSVSRTASLVTNMISNNYSAFVNDDFKLNRRLTLSMGLRYRINQPWYPESGLGAIFIADQQSTVIPSAPIGLNYIGDKGVPSTVVKTSYTDFSPRFGFAFDPQGDGKTAIRGGYGIYYDNYSSFPFYYANGTTQPYGVNFSLTLADVTNPFAGVTNPFPYKFDPSNVKFTTPVNVRVGLDPDLRPGYVQSWNLTLERAVRALVVRGAYVGSKGTHLGNMYLANPAIYIPGVDAQGQPLSTLANTNQRRTYHPDQFGYIAKWGSIGNSTYHAMEWSLRGNVTRNLLMTSAWTYSHSIDDNSSPRGVDVDSVGNPFNRRLNKGNSDFDFRHIFTASAVLTGPAFRGMPAVARQVLGGWTTSWMGSAQSGGWITVFTGQDTSLSGGFGNDRAQQVLDDYRGPRTSRGAARLNWVNPAAFALPAVGTFGNLGRNSIRGPARWVADMSAGKDFNLYERAQLQFRMAGYNIFNHSRLGNCAALQYCSMNNSVTSGAALGAIGVQSGRTIQFSLKLRY